MMINACLVAAVAAGTCHALPGDFYPPAPPPLPEWATQEWIYDAAGIVAGETVHDCTTCDRWIACTVVEDVTLRGYHPWRLRPGRWHGWRRPGVGHLAAIEDALKGGCTDTPNCAFLGNAKDYSFWLHSGRAKGLISYITGNEFGVIICIPERQ